jgi:hypothetical protein
MKITLKIFLSIILRFFFFTCPHKNGGKNRINDFYFMRHDLHPIELLLKKLSIILVDQIARDKKGHCANEIMTKIAEGVMQLVNIKVFNLKINRKNDYLHNSIRVMMGLRSPTRLFE